MSTTIATFAPAARHASACATIFVGSFSALFIEYVTPAFLSAAPMYFGSNCTQRTDDFVSGSRTQTWTFALLAAVATALMITAARTISPTAVHFVNSLLTCPPLDRDFV